MFNAILLEIMKQEKIDIATMISVIWLMNPLDTATCPINKEPMINKDPLNPLKDLFPAWKKIWKNK